MSGRGERAAGRTPKGGVYRPRNARASPLYQCADRHLAELRSEGRLERLLEERVIERFIKCGDAHHEFACVYCPECRHAACYGMRWRGIPQKGDCQIHCNECHPL